MPFMSIVERLGLDRPIVQAGMGGGISRHELAAAVCGAGGLGTIAVMGSAAIDREVAAVREITNRPVAVNLLLPFARKSWFDAAEHADVVVTFWGAPRRRTGRVWLHQVGSVDEARATHAAGADAVIVQGVEAGGHVRGTTAALELLDQVRRVLPTGFPLLLAGGIATRADVQAALAAGADAAVAGTRFLLSNESHAHSLYKQRLLAADHTLLTDLFGLGWPATHRVVPNAATEHQLRKHGRTPLPNRVLNRCAAVSVRYVPDVVQRELVMRQDPRMPFLSPQTPTDDMPDSYVDSGPLYAGETVARISELAPAADIVSALAG